MARKVSILILAIAFSLHMNAQTVIQMVEDEGVYKVPCEVNGLKVKMIFDTGAAAVSISKPIAEMMLDNGYLSKNDFEGSASSITADGRIVDYAVINIKTIKISNITITNVRAAVVDNLSAPLLLGQSAIQKLGEISIKGDKLIIHSTTRTSETQQSDSDYFERWDENNYSYSNFTYGFGWSLPKEYEWIREIGQEKHTPFRASFGPVVVFVNAQVNDRIDDLWKVYDKYTAMIDAADIAMEKRSGLMVYERTQEKCTIVGKHAIKTTFKEYFKDSRYTEPVENYAEEYTLIVNGYTLIIAVKLPQSIYYEYDCTQLISDIFKGFRLIIAH